MDWTWTMSFFFPSPSLGAGETVVWSHKCQRSIPQRAFIGGTLLLTEDRLVFQPARLTVKHPEVLSYPLADCARVETVERTWTAYDGGTHRRIRLVMADGSSELFVIKDVDEVASFLSDAIHRTASPGE
jgi:hypothetical protein